MTFNDYWQKTWNTRAYQPMFESVLRELAEAAWNASKESSLESIFKKSEAIITANTHRGRINSAASYAVGILEDVAAEIKGELK